MCAASRGLIASLYSYGFLEARAKAHPPPPLSIFHSFHLCNKRKHIARLFLLFLFFFPLFSGSLFSIPSYIGSRHARGKLFLKRTLNAAALPARRLIEFA